MKACLDGLTILLTNLLAEASGAGAPGDATYAGTPQFQAYIFWAYGLGFALIGLLMAGTFWQSRRLSERIAYLEDRFQRAHPEGETRS